MTAIWRFVDKPVTTPAILLDMNDKIEWAINGDKEFDLSPPTLVKSTSQNNMGDGAHLTASHYNNRILKFSLFLDPYGTRTIAQKEQLLTELNLELGKESNLIMYKGSASSEPIFFRTVRSDDYKFVSRAGAKKSWDVDLEVEAEPFGIGLMQNLLTNASISNDPSTGTNPTRVDLTGIEGDAPSPSFIRFGTSLPASTYFYIAQRTVAATSLTPFAQAEGGTMGTDTATAALGANFSPSSGTNGVTCTFTTNPGMVDRLTVNVPFTQKGTYRVYARVRFNGTGVYKLRYALGTGSSYNGPTVEFNPTVQAFEIVNLGLFDYPYAADIPDEIGFSKTGMTFPTQTFTIQARRDSGSSSMDIDYLYFMPADEALCEAQQTESVGFFIIDGQQEKVYGMSSASDPFGATKAMQGNSVMVAFGGIPELVPGVTNRWFIIRGRAALPSVTSNLWVSYWPRWRVVATP